MMPLLYVLSSFNFLGILHHIPCQIGTITQVEVTGTGCVRAADLQFIVLNVLLELVSKRCIQPCHALRSDLYICLTDSSRKVFSVMLGCHGRK